MKVERGEYGASPECEGTNAALSGTTPTSVNPEATPQKIEHSSPFARRRWLDCSPPTKANRVQSPAQSPRVSQVEIVPDDAAGRRVFSGISRFPRLCIPVLLLSHTHSALAGSQDLVVKGRPYLATQLNEQPRCAGPLASCFTLKRIVLTSSGRTANQVVILRGSEMRPTPYFCEMGCSCLQLTQSRRGPCEMFATCYYIKPWRGSDARELKVLISARLGSSERGSRSHVPRIMLPEGRGRRMNYSPVSIQDNLHTPAAKECQYVASRKDTSTRTLRELNQLSAVSPRGGRISHTEKAVCLQPNTEARGCGPGPSAIMHDRCFRNDDQPLATTPTELGHGRNGVAVSLMCGYLLFDWLREALESSHVSDWLLRAVKLTILAGLLAGKKVARHSLQYRAHVLFRVALNNVEGETEVNMEHHRNAKIGEGAGDPRENPPTRFPRAKTRESNEVHPGGEASALPTAPPRPVGNTVLRRCHRADDHTETKLRRGSYDADARRSDTLLGSDVIFVGRAAASCRFASGNCRGTTWFPRGPQQPERSQPQMTGNPRYGKWIDTNTGKVCAFKVKKRESDKGDTNTHP
ncbi:hypothetical protein PR048_022827 [Dryococelus australis]|uniref:Uncharacterized protein n=1 Tax=Dryococelus australis TaxID=614101 RepID=A0ABQ9GSB7_9NEOP|nr:hypothetical protein PR048_022827 [Dryococelus australis]